jgi:hypothetical protein
MEVGFEASQGKAGEGKSILDLMFRSTTKGGAKVPDVLRTNQEDGGW